MVIDDSNTIRFHGKSLSWLKGIVKFCDFPDPGSSIGWGRDNSCANVIPHAFGITYMLKALNWFLSHLESLFVKRVSKNALKELQNILPNCNPSPPHPYMEKFTKPIIVRSMLGGHIAEDERTRLESSWWSSAFPRLLIPDFVSLMSVFETHILRFAGEKCRHCRRMTQGDFVAAAAV